MPASEQGRGFSRELHEATYKPLDQGLGSQYYLASVVETETLHHPLSMLTPMWLPPKGPERLPKTQALHVKGQGQREDSSFTGKSNLSPNCPSASLGSEAH